MLPFLLKSPILPWPHLELSKHNHHGWVHNPLSIKPQNINKLPRPMIFLGSHPKTSSEDSYLMGFEIIMEHFTIPGIQHHTVSTADCLESLLSIKKKKTVAWRKTAWHVRNLKTPEQSFRSGLRLLRQSLISIVRYDAVCTASVNQIALVFFISNIKCNFITNHGASSSLILTPKK